MEKMHGEDEARISSEAMELHADHGVLIPNTDATLGKQSPGVIPSNVTGCHRDFSLFIFHRSFETIFTASAS
jgi:hypothetical protein